MHVNRIETAVGAVLAVPGAFIIGSEGAERVYTATVVEGAERDVNCLEAITELPIGQPTALPDICDGRVPLSDDALKNTFDTHWVVEDGVVKEVETKTSNHGEVAALLKDAKAEHVSVLENQDTAANVGGIGALVLALTLLGARITIRYSKSHRRPDIAKQGIVNRATTLSSRKPVVKEA